MVTLQRQILQFSTGREGLWIFDYLVILFFFFVTQMANIYVLGFAKGHSRRSPFVLFASTVLWGSGWCSARGHMAQSGNNVSTGQQ